MAALVCDSLYGPHRLLLPAAQLRLSTACTSRVPTGMRQVRKCLEGVSEGASTIVRRWEACIERAFLRADWTALEHFYGIQAVADKLMARERAKLEAILRSGEDATNVTRVLTKERMDSLYMHAVVHLVHRLSSCASPRERAGPPSAASRCASNAVRTSCSRSTTKCRTGQGTRAQDAPSARTRRAVSRLRSTAQPRITRTVRAEERAPTFFQIVGFKSPYRILNEPFRKRNTPRCGCSSAVEVC